MLIFDFPLRMLLGAESCAKCGKPQAHWQDPHPVVVGEGEFPCCGWCLLYDTPWGREHLRELGRFVLEVNETRRRTGQPVLALDERGRVVTGDAADVIVSAIYIGSRLAAQRLGGEDA